MTDYSLEKRYVYYQQGGGNSFIEQEMNEHILPRRQYKNRVKRSSDKI